MPADPAFETPAPDARPSSPAPRRRASARLVIETSVERLVLATSVYWALSANRAFLGAALRDRAPSDPATWQFVATLIVALVALHALLVGLVATRRTVKPLIAVLLVLAAGAAYYMRAYGVFVDPSMLRNVVHTDTAEASELLSMPMLAHLLLFAGLPLLLLARIRIRPIPRLRAMGIRLAFLLAATAVLVAAVLSVFQPFGSLMRNHRELRYLITPANLVWSTSRVVIDETRGAARPRQAIGLDAAPGASWAARRKPLVLLLVVGESARAASWGLDGYERQTTPELSRLGVVNFGNVTACGTSTEVSLPCMFAPVGRRDYDEARIRGQESLLHGAARAGAGVHWRDNQSGCKGVCEGLPNDTVTPVNAPGLCDDGRCLDEGLVRDLDRRLAAAHGTQLWVLHMRGNHGPSYFRRYPRPFAQYQPECLQDDLQRCSIEQIRNSYDNALLYTDHVLASAIAKLRERAGKVDSAVVYVSDHGESLGEHGLFLHGVPQAIAPTQQTRVPMVFWSSGGFEQGSGLQPGCLTPALREQATAALTHDHLFHTVLGLLDIRTTLYEPSLDLASRCRRSVPARS